MFWWWSRNSDTATSSLDSGIFYAILFTLAGLTLVGTVAYMLWDPLGNAQSSSRRFLQRAFLVLVTGALSVTLWRFLLTGNVPEVFVPLATSVALASLVFCFSFALGIKFISKNNRRVVSFSAALVLCSLLVVEMLLLTICMVSLTETLYVLALTASTTIGAIHVAKTYLRAPNENNNSNDKASDSLGAFALISLGLFIGLILQIVVRLVVHNGAWDSVAFWIANAIALAGIWLGVSVIYGQDAEATQKTNSRK